MGAAPIAPAKAGEIKSALDLLVLRIGLADHADLALAADDLAGAADLLDTGLDLHGNPLSGQEFDGRSN